MGNIALVTGASAGFGRAIVEHLIADGCHRYQISGKILLF